MNPTEISATVFAIVFGAALIGMALKTMLPDEHLSPETKDVVKLGVGLIGTMAALLLGLLVASAKSSYDERSTELTQMAANVVLLDRELAHYGPEAANVRSMLKAGVQRLIDAVWTDDGGARLGTQISSREVVYDAIDALTPQTDSQRRLQSEAESLATGLGQERMLLFAQSGSSISKPFLIVVTFWLSVLFLSFGLFAPRNATVVITLLVTALSVAGALFLVMELDHPFSGWIQISSLPLRNALAAMGK